MLFGIAAIMSVGIIDAYFIGRIGSDELAAVSFIFPITIALSSLGVGVIAGISSVVARALGSGDSERARQIGNLGMLIAAIAGVVIAAIIYIIRTPLFELMNAADELMPLIDAYMVPYAIGFPLLLANMGGNGVLRGQGAAKRASGILMSFAVVNVILDPILIAGWFVPGFDGLGIAGAVYATIAGWAIGLALSVWFVQTSDIRISIKAAFSADWAGGLKSLVKVGGPAAMSNAVNPIGLSVLTALLATYGKDAVAGFGAAGRLQSFCVVPMLALSSSIGAIVGQNWGAGQGDRARLALMMASGFCIIYGLAIAAGLFFAREWVAMLFTDDPAVITAITSYIAIAAWGFAGYGILVVANGALNAVDRAEVALAQSVFRVLAVMIPAAWLLGDMMQAQAIYVAELAANTAGAMIAGAMAYYILSRR